jgi:hypothetical protein
MRHFQHCVATAALVAALASACGEQPSTPEEVVRQQGATAATPAGLPGAPEPGIATSEARLSGPRTITPPPAEYLARQQKYLARLRELEPSLVGLSQEEQSARRSALKRSVMEK